MQVGTNFSVLEHRVTEVPSLPKTNDTCPLLNGMGDAAYIMVLHV